MEAFDWSTIVSHGVAIAIGIAGSYFGLFQGKLSAVKDLVDVLYEAVADGKVTPEEIKAIVAAARKIVD